MMKRRRRNVNVTFRMSPEESEALNVRVKLSGLTKQDYIIMCLSGPSIEVTGNPRVYKALRDQMAQIYDELKRICDGDEMTEAQLFTLQLIAQTLQGLKGEQ
ncbi:mobilization protein [Eubacterium sp.]|uniref:plasmid mobilization protein n=1 Tax=Eubacterium sp. TaxID=142586 RepID=UPI0026DF9990|nr:mobilization protein [Eubacterium sp.]MDO5433008.1 mobilization protein [Eubacterium sp.]